MYSSISLNKCIHLCNQSRHGTLLSPQKVSSWPLVLNLHSHKHNSSDFHYHILDMLILEFNGNEIIQYVLNKRIFKPDLKRNQTSSSNCIAAVLLWYVKCLTYHKYISLIFVCTLPQIMSYYFLNSITCIRVGIAKQIKINIIQCRNLEHSMENHPHCCRIYESW